MALHVVASAISASGARVMSLATRSAVPRATTSNILGSRGAMFGPAFSARRLFATSEKNSATTSSETKPATPAARKANPEKEARDKLKKEISASNAKFRAAARKAAAKVREAQKRADAVAKQRAAHEAKLVRNAKLLAEQRSRKAALRERVAARRQRLAEEQRAKRGRRGVCASFSFRFLRQTRVLEEGKHGHPELKS
eukprot:TRINITY_DN7395_c0_g1_i2.p2 TRINITY_DN7395_c0_g1~~TRINITY_DN7395_c0_g1_i2.p2  ORF type:complete len:198 (-),score=40.88 TRINITY_DN7395_c0_g1_i2:134-727(-)